MLGKTFVGSSQNSPWRMKEHFHSLHEVTKVQQEAKRKVTPNQECVCDSQYQSARNICVVISLL